MPASAADALFSWRDHSGALRPLTKGAWLRRVNEVWSARGWGTSFGHSFRIGGASHFLARGANPEVVRMAGRWRSLAFEVYVRAFERVVSRHLASIDSR